MKSLKDFTHKDCLKSFLELSILKKVYLGECDSDSQPDVYANIYNVMEDVNDKKILEVGGNDCLFLSLLKHRGADVYALELGDPGETAKNHGVKICLDNILEYPEWKNLRPQHLFPEADFDEFDYVISRLVLEKKIMKTYENVRKMLKLLRPLAKTHIHEQTADHLMSDMDFWNIGYKGEICNDLIGGLNKIYALERVDLPFKTHNN